MPVHSLATDIQHIQECPRRHNEDGEDLVAERAASESYRDTVNFLGTGDATTRRAFEAILATEEKEHEEDLLRLIEDLGCGPLR